MVGGQVCRLTCAMLRVHTVLAVTAHTHLRRTSMRVVAWASGSGSSAPLSTSPLPTLAVLPSAGPPSCWSELLLPASPRSTARATSGRPSARSAWSGGGTEQGRWCGGTGTARTCKVVVVGQNDGNRPQPKDRTCRACSGRGCAPPGPIPPCRSLGWWSRSGWKRESARQGKQCCKGS